MLQLILPESREGRGEGLVWADREDQTLEHQPADIVVGLIVRAEEDYRAGLAGHHQWLLQRRENARAEIVRRRDEAEQKARQARGKAEREARALLLAQARAHGEAAQIRVFVAAVRAAADADEGAREAVQVWTDWAQGIAERLDPLARMSVSEGRLGFGGDLEGIAGDFQ